MLVAAAGRGGVVLPVTTDASKTNESRRSVDIILFFDLRLSITNEKNIMFVLTNYK